MALIKCPECGKDVSDKAKKCPNCGYLINSKFIFKLTKKTTIVLCSVIGIAVALCAGVAIYNSAPVQSYVYKMEHDREMLKTSEMAFKEAKEAEKNNNYAVAINKYKEVIKEDKSYEKAQNKIAELQDTYKEQLLSEAESYAQNKKYKEAIQNIDEAISFLGTSNELTELKQKYADLKTTQYAKVIVTDKTETPENISDGIFYNYFHLSFNITNHSDKPIQGMKVIVTISDLFGQEINHAVCEFTGQTIEPGKTLENIKLSYKLNKFNETDMKIFNTGFSDLQFICEISNIVYTDGSTVNMD